MSEWIPVSERLPNEEKKKYWVCTDTEYQCECRWTNVNPILTHLTMGWHWNTFDIPQYSNVVAWMPLPEPYKGGANYSESELDEAIDMAIEALPAETVHGDAETATTTDCISRQQAVEAVANAIWNFPNECYQNLNNYDMALALATDALAGLPPVTPTERTAVKIMNECKYQGQIDSSCGEQFCICWAYAESIDCEYQEFDYNPDGRINIVTCGMIGEKGGDE